MSATLRHKVEHLALRFGFLSLSWPPARIVYGTLALIALLATPIAYVRDRLLWKKRASLRRNFFIAAGRDISELQLLRMTYLSLRHVLWLVADFARIPQLSDAEIHEIVPAEEINKIIALQRQGQGVLVYTGHYGVFELLGCFCTIFGLPLTTVVKGFRNPLINETITKIREARGQKIVRNKNVLMELKKALKAREAVGVVLDENTRRKPVFVPFFGVLASSNAAIVNLQRLLKIPALVVAVHRSAPGRFRFRVVDEFAPSEYESLSRQDAEIAILTRINEAHERAIREYPDQYLWSMRRWRHRPEGEVSDRDGLPPRCCPAEPLNF